MTEVRWVGWRLLLRRGGIQSWGSKMHVRGEPGRTLCGRKLPHEGSVFQWYYDRSNGETCLCCEAALRRLG